MTEEKLQNRKNTTSGCDVKVNSGLPGKHADMAESSKVTKITWAGEFPQL